MDAASSAARTNSGVKLLMAVGLRLHAHPHITKIRFVHYDMIFRTRFSDFGGLDPIGDSADGPSVGILAPVFRWGGRRLSSRSIAPRPLPPTVPSSMHKSYLGQGCHTCCPAEKPAKRRGRQACQSLRSPTDPFHRSLQLSA
eukprot:148556-Chlamydomonas_euryale.AAC.1